MAHINEGVVMEQRQTERYPVQFPVRFGGDLIEGEGLVTDLSTTGCGLQTRSRVKDRAYVHLFLYLPPEGVPMKVELAAVRWVSEQAVGLEFIRLSATHQKRLREYVKLLEMTPPHKRAAAQPVTGQIESSAAAVS